MHRFPTVVEERYTEIVNVIENFCKKELNNEYLFFAKKLCLELCEIENTPINKGKVDSWACGIVHALGLRNNLFNSKEKISIKAGELYKAFKISGSTGLSKSKEIRSLINLEDSCWSLEEKYEIKNDCINKNILDEVALSAVDENHKSDQTVEEIVKKAIGEVKEAIKGLEDDFIGRSINETLKKANKIADEAWSQKNYKKKAKLAKEALEVSGDCTEAYIILSHDNLLSREEQKDLAIKALEAAKRVIGEENIDRYIGRFLDDEVAKPYFSAKYRLGGLLWDMNERTQAIEEYIELLRIAPEDNLMIRGILLSWLIAENREAEVEEIFNTYKNDYLAAVKFSKALYLYKLGNIEEAERALKIANVANKFVTSYITKQKRLPKIMPKLTKLGTEEEAIYYIGTGEVSWREVPGAIQWVKEFKKNQPF